MEILKIKSPYYTRFNCIFTIGCIFDLITFMGLQKPNIAVYSSGNKMKSISSISKPADILHLLKKNKREERKEKFSKILVLISIFLLFLFLNLLVFA
tara:strand:- start:2472 stop:2762 length:291 start_codon:yes stop_codon:yes gene_type:complete